jgi:hypothetical protein
MLAAPGESCAFRSTIPRKSMFNMNPHRIEWLYPHKAKWDLAAKPVRRET